MGSFRLRARNHGVAAVLALSLVGTSTTAFAQPVPDGKAALADGDRATKAKDWTTAARFYDAANKATPSSEALDGLANAQYQGGNLGDAYVSYNEWIGKYGAKAPAAKKTAAEARIRELGAKTGSVNVNVSEAGATILVDDKPAGTSPLASPLRVVAGSHRIKVTKDGFAPFEQTLSVVANGAAAISANLVVTATKGKVAVKEQSGKAVRVLVDGVDMGEAPWSGELDPGPHEIGARAPGLVAAPQKITVERGKTEDITLTASSSSAPVKIGTSDGKGLIYLDGKLVGEGSFATEIPAGPHKLRITRDGYDPFEEDVTVKDKEPYSRTVTLKISSAITTGTVVETERFDGVYGGVSLLAMFTPGGTGSSVQTDCDAQGKIPTLASCDSGSGFGGGIGGYVGYSWDPVGIEVFAALQYDQRTLKNDWNAASTDPGFGPDPARYESFNLRRIGGMLVPRVRGQWTFKKIRVAFAAGAGVDYRAMHLERRTTAKTGDPVQHDTYSSDATGYWSPVVSLEPSIAYRITKTMAVQVGMQLFFDAPATFLNGKNDPMTNPESTHALGFRGLATPAYTLATDLQVFVGPFVGLQFGP